jgi:hypothetical protein
MSEDRSNQFTMISRTTDEIAAKNRFDQIDQLASWLQGNQELIIKQTGHLSLFGGYMPSPNEIKLLAFSYRVRCSYSQRPHRRHHTKETQAYAEPTGQEKSPWNKENDQTNCFEHEREKTNNNLFFVNELTPEGQNTNSVRNQVIHCISNRCKEEIKMHRIISYLHSSTQTN